MLIDTYTYADGALRLTRHGDKAGGTVLMHVPSGTQLDVEDHYTEGLTNNLEALFDGGGDTPAQAFNCCAALYDRLDLVLPPEAM